MKGRRTMQTGIPSNSVAVACCAVLLLCVYELSFICVFVPVCSVCSCEFLRLSRGQKCSVCRIHRHLMFSSFLFFSSFLLPPYPPCSTFPRSIATRLQTFVTLSSQREQPGTHRGDRQPGKRPIYESAVYNLFPRPWWLGRGRTELWTKLVEFDLPETRRVSHRTRRRFYQANTRIPNRILRTQRIYPF